MGGVGLYGRVLVFCILIDFFDWWEKFLDYRGYISLDML